MTSVNLPSIFPKIQYLIKTLDEDTQETLRQEEQVEVSLYLKTSTNPSSISRYQEGLEKRVTCILTNSLHLLERVSSKYARKIIEGYSDKTSDKIYDFLFNKASYWLLL